MPTTYTSLDFVQLPRLTGLGSLGLGQQMLAAADSQKKSLPKSLTKAHSALTAAHAALQTALVDQLGHGTETPAEEAPAIQELDRILDNSWAGLDDRLQGLARLPAGKPGVAEAAALRKRLFPTGLGFLKLNYRLEWSESQTRLELIDREGLTGSIDQLAGKVFLQSIREGHESYGRALGMTAALETPATMPQVRGAMDAFLEALRNYIVKVMASVEPDEPATQTTADALLAPFAAWNAAAKRTGKGEPLPGDASAPEPASPTGGSTGDK